MNKEALHELREKADFSRAGKPLLIGMAAILVMVAVAVGHVLSGAATSSEFSIESKSEAGEASSSAPAVQTVFVHISGSVCNPGLYELQEGSRLADAVQASGGFADDADEDSCNLARVVTDGEHIIIPSANDAASPEGIVQDNSSQTTGSMAPSRININTATASQLESLPGIGTSTAQKIISDRTQNGPFKSVEELMRVSGIGEKKLASIADLICV